MPSMQKMIRRWVMAALFAAATAQATPVVVSLNPGYSFQAYTGTAAVNAGNLDTRNVLFRIEEQRIGGVQAWYLFFDPSGSQGVTATLDFGAPILDVLTTSSALAATRSTWQVDVDGDGLLDDYANTLLMGLEGQDSASWVQGGSLLSIAWNSWDPGDHVRVLVQAVPEPGSTALVAAALGALALSRRRKTR
jgi:hypothetical protein